MSVPIPSEVSLFITCVCDAVYPQVGTAVVGVLRHLGIKVNFPSKQVCCGQPAYNAGHHRETRQVAEEFIMAMEGSEYVVSPSGSCAAMIKHTYLQLFAGDPVWEPRAKALAQRCYEFSEFLVRVLGIDDLGAVYTGKATYHCSCHMTRLLGEKEAPLSLLNNVRGLELIPLQRPQDCCGFGGTFSVKMPEVSLAIVDSKVDDVVATGAKILIGSDAACLMNISGRAQRRGVPLQTKHVAEILWEGLKQAAGAATVVKREGGAGQ